MNTSLAARPPPRSDRPFLPEDVDPSRALTRAMLAHLLREIRGPMHGSAEDIAAREWPRDIVTRTATSAINTTTAAALQPNVVGAFVSGLQGQSGAARLMAAGISVSLEGVATVVMARASYPGPGPVFIGEGLPIPVPQPSLFSSAVGPMKRLAMMEVFTGELAEHSVPNAELVVSTMMSEASARALDQAVFSSVAASSLRPAGILFGVTPLTGALGGGIVAMATDVEAIGNALAAAGGGTRFMLFVSAGRRWAMPLVAQTIDFDVVPVIGLATNTVIGVDPGGFASGWGPDPSIEVSQQATLHLEDTTPVDIGTAAGVAAPTRAMFQTQSYALRLILRCAWQMRAPGLVQVVQSVTW